MYSEGAAATARTQYEAAAQGADAPHNATSHLLLLCVPQHLDISAHSR